MGPMGRGCFLEVMYNVQNKVPHVLRLKSGADIVVATPSRLLELKKKGLFLDSDVCYVAVDEARLPILPTVHPSPIGPHC